MIFHHVAAISPKFEKFNDQYGQDAMSSNVEAYVSINEMNRASTPDSPAQPAAPTVSPPEKRSFCITLNWLLILLFISVEKFATHAWYTFTVTA